MKKNKGAKEANLKKMSYNRRETELFHVLPPLSSMEKRNQAICHGQRETNGNLHWEGSKSHKGVEGENSIGARLALGRTVSAMVDIRVRTVDLPEIQKQILI